MRLIHTLWLTCVAAQAVLLDGAALAHQIAPKQAVQGYESQFPAMGTLVTLKAYSDDAAKVDRLFKAAEKRVLEITATLTDYDAESETRQLTTIAFETPTHVSNDLWAVLESSERWHRCSQGAFDSSLGQLTSLWRKYRRPASRHDAPPGTPEQAQIQAAFARSGWRHVKLDDESHNISLLKENIRLDFGGIGKGYAVDQAFQVLHLGGLTSCFVNISGNMRFGSPPPGRNAWRIEVSPVQENGQALGQIEIANCAVATSGDLWQYTLLEGQRRSHILDPRTGIGVLGPIAATVIAPTAMDADACATAACILGFDDLPKHHAALGGLAILIARPSSNRPSTLAQTLTLGDFPDISRPIP